jgi:hypothetical protein
VNARPTIPAEPGQLPWLVDEAEKVLLADYRRWSVFQRAGILMRVAIADRQDPLIQRPAGALILRAATVPMMLDIFNRAIRWVNLKDNDIDCPAKIAQVYLSRAGLWRLPRLLGIVEAPIIRSDGSILTQPGYDEATRLILESHVAWPALPSPSLEAAQAAIKCLLEPFAEFPFANPAGWSVLISTILTALVRRLLFSAPAHAFDKPSQGSGGSLLADCISLTAVGRCVASTNANSDEEELRKKLVSVLIAADPIISLDNITKPLRSDVLASILTLDRYKDRILGSSQDVEVPTNTLFLLTGNNLTFSGDMPSRVISARLEPNCERPEERTFAISDLRTHILQRRPQLVTAALTILQSYFFAGRPPQNLKPFGRFEQWSNEIRSAIVWAGLPDPCISREDVIAVDPERDATLTVLGSWFRCLGEEATTLSSLVARAQTDDDLQQALLDIATDQKHADTVSPRRLGAWCRARLGRVVRDLKLEQGVDARSGFKTWRVVSIKTGVKPPAPTDEPIVERRF